MIGYTHPNTTCVKSVALTARFLFSETKLLSEPLKGGMIWKEVGADVSEVSVHGHLLPCVCTEHHGSGICSEQLFIECTPLSPETGIWGDGRHWFLFPRFISLAHSAEVGSMQGPCGS